MNDWSEQFYQDYGYCYSNSDPDRMEAFLLQEIKHLEQTGGAVWQLAFVNNKLGIFYRETGQYRRALETFEHTRKLGEGCLNQETYAIILNNMAETFRIMQEYRQSEELFLEAAKLYEQEDPIDVSAYASVLNNLSLVYQSTRQLDKAIRCLENAFLLIESLPHYSQKLIVTCNNLTALYHAIGDDQRALRYANRAIYAYEKLSEDERCRYTTVLNSLAGFLYSKGDYEQALELYKKSAKNIRRFWGDTEEYGITCQNMRWVYEKLGDRASAVNCLRKAVRVYQQIFGTDHIRTRTAIDELTRMTTAYHHWRKDSL